MSERRRGRPAIDDSGQSVRVSVTMSAKQFDAMHAQAQQQRTTIQEVIRRTLAEFTHKKLSK